MCEPLWWQTLGGVWFHGPLLNVNILKWVNVKYRRKWWIGTAHMWSFAELVASMLPAHILGWTLQ